MSDIVRWTVRGVNKDTIALIAEIHSISGEPYGELVNEAIWFWYDSRPEEDDEHLDEPVQ